MLKEIFKIINVNILNNRQKTIKQKDNQYYRTFYIIKYFK